jgi:type I restriction enzyme S subunit
MKDSGVPWLGKVPEHWELRRLGASVLDCINGVWGDDPNGSDDLLCVRVADFDRMRLRVRFNRPTFRAVKESDRRRRLLNNGDLLLEKSGGGDLNPVGVVMLYDHEASAVCSNFIARMPVAGGFDSAYLAYLHSHLYSIGINIRSVKQTTGIQNLDSSQYLSETVAFPPFSEQSAIVSFLDHADRKIRHYIRAKQRLIKLLEEQQQVIIHRAVTRGLDPNVRLKASGVEWLGDVPEHWHVERTKNLFRLRTQKSGLAHGLELLSIYTHIGVRPRKDLEEKGNKASSTDDYWIVRKGDLIVNKLLAWMGAVGVSEYEGVTSPAYDILMPIRSLCPAFYHYLFRTKLFLQQFKQRSRGIMDMRLRLYFDQLGQIPIVVPPVDEQSAIVAYYVAATSDLDQTIATARLEIDLLREFRTRLIADVVTGKLDVRQVAAGLPEEAMGDELIEDEALEDLEAGEEDLDLIDDADG